jgi:hypothetical protein
MAAAIRAAGQELVDAGLSTEAALDQLAADPQRWVAIGASGARAVAERQTSAGTQ